MKIQCDSCSTMYSIADDAVAGGVYRVRCKRCQNIITIHGPPLVQSPATASHTPSFEPTFAPPRLRAQRNENSLLFSVNDLSEPNPKAHSGRVENSGLLDIRRMAKAYKEESKPRAGEEFASITPVGQVMPHLVAAPPVKESGPRHLIWAFGALAGVIAVAALVVALVLVKDNERSRAAKTDTEQSTERASPPSVLASRDDGAENQAAPGRASKEEATGEQPAREKAAKKQSTQATQAAEESSAQSTREKAAPEQAARSATERAAPEQATQAAKESAAKTTSTQKDHAERAQTSTESSAEQKPNPAKCLDEVACLLAEVPPACCARHKTSANPRSDDDDEPRTNIPERPSRSAITRSMSKVGGLVTSCGTQYPASGQVTLSIKVDESGDVAQVTVKKSPSTALGQCVAKAARRTSFPESRRGITFSYPFLFR